MSWLSLGRIRESRGRHLHRAISHTTDASNVAMTTMHNEHGYLSTGSISFQIQLTQIGEYGLEVEHAQSTAEVTK